MNKLADQIKRMANRQTRVELTRLMRHNWWLIVSLVLLFCGLVSSNSSIEQPENQQQPEHKMSAVATSGDQLQSRTGGLEPGDYIDEAGELDVMSNQQQIPTATLMSAAGHMVPDGFFLPGGSVPAYHQQQQQVQQQQQQQHHHHQHHQQQQQQQRLLHQHQQLAQVEAMLQQASNPMARLVVAQRLRQVMAAAAAGDLASSASEQGPSTVSSVSSPSDLIDLNAYNLVDSRDPSSGALETGEQSYISQEQHRELAEQQVAAELAALYAHYQQHQQHQQQQQQNDQVAASESLQSDVYGQSLGPSYQLAPGSDPSGYQTLSMTSPHIEMASASGRNNHLQSHYHGQGNPSKPFGLPTRSSNKEPSGMLKPLGNPKTVSSPLIDFVAHQLPKTSQLEKLADKLPQSQTPTVFSFASSKDPVGDKSKAINQKKRSVMRQAEQLARMAIKSVNDKFGTNIGDQSDLPFILSSLTPLGLAQNILFDPTLLVSLINSAEKAYQSDVLPAPAKLAIRPVLNIFRVPNKKRGDKGNHMSNIISFLASGGQTPSNTGSGRYRPGTGIEKATKNKSY